MSRLFSAFIMLSSRTMFSWPFNSCRNMTSLNVRCASVALWKASKTFLRATTCLNLRSIAYFIQRYFPDNAVGPLAKFLNNFELLQNLRLNFLGHNLNINMLIHNQISGCKGAISVTFKMILSSSPWITRSFLGLYLHFFIISSTSDYEGVLLISPW